MPSGQAELDSNIEYVSPTSRAKSHARKWVAVLSAIDQFRETDALLLRREALVTYTSECCKYQRHRNIVRDERCKEHSVDEQLCIYTPHTCKQPLAPVFAGQLNV
jgi:hypothetical protein